MSLQQLFARFVSARLQAKLTLTLHTDLSCATAKVL